MDQQNPVFSSEEERVPLDRTPEQIEEPPVNPVQTARRRIAGTFLSLLFIIAFSSVVFGIAYLALEFVYPNVLELPGASILLSSLPSYAIAMPLSLFLFRMIPKTVPKKKKIALTSLIGFLCLALILTEVGAMLGEFVNSLFGSITGEIPENALDVVADATPLWMQFLFFAVLAPIFEEIFYRKLLYDRLATFGELPAILICGVTFGLIHGNFHQFFYATLVGLLLTFLYAKTGRLLHTILLHALLNFSGTVLTEWLNNLFDSLEDTFPYAWLVFSIVGGLAAILGLIFAIRYWVVKKEKLTFSAGSIPLTRKQWAQALFLNPATWIFLITMILTFLADFLTPYLVNLLSD